MAKPAKPRVPKPKQYHCAIGTKNMLGNKYSFVDEGKAREQAVKALRGQEEWCRTYNQAGIIPINDAISEVANTGLMSTPKEILCCFDEHSGMTMKITLWREMPPPPKQPGTVTNINRRAR